MNKNHFSWLIVAIISLCFLVLSGCNSLQVTSLDQNANPLTIDHRVQATAGIERNQLGKNDQSPEVKDWPNKLPEVLKQEGVFSQIIYPFKKNDVVDLIVHSTTTGKFRDGGAANFFTWWPGPFIFAQAWRGTQFIYDLSADVELTDGRTSKVVGKYHAEASYKLVHSSWSAFHILGTALIIPGIIKASLSTSPRDAYLREIYKKAYPEIWMKIAASISEDQALSQYLTTRPRRNNIGVNP